MAGRLGALAEELGQMVGSTPAAALLRPMLPKLLTDLGKVPEGELLRFIDAVAARLYYVRHGVLPGPQ